MLSNIAPHPFLEFIDISALLDEHLVHLYLSVGHDALDKSNTLLRSCDAHAVDCVILACRSLGT